MKIFNPEVLRDRIRRHDFSYKKFSELCGISYYSLKKILAGKCLPSQEVVEKFADVTGYPLPLFFIDVPESVVNLIRNEVPLEC